MKFLNRLLLTMLLGAISFPAGASSVEISHRQESLMAGSGAETGQPNAELARTEIVTVEADLGTDADVERAYEAAANVAIAMEAGARVEGSSKDPLKTLVEISNPDVTRSARAQVALERFKSRFRAAHTKTHQFSQATAEKMKSFAADPAAPVRNVITAAKNNRYKTTLFLIKLVSATGAASVSVIAVSGLPPTNFEYIELIARALPTGIMSALMVSYADKYSDFVIKPWIFAKHVDDSKWLASIVSAVQKPFRKGKEQIKELPIKIGLYFDQLIKSLALEFPFVFISTVFTSSYDAAMDSLGHILENVFNGGAGQMLYDQTIIIIHDMLADNVMAQHPEGSPERTTKLARLKRFRDTGQVVNSLFQVWAVLLSAKGYSLATTAVQAYAITGVIARIAVIPFENKVLRNAKANAASVMCSHVFAP